MKPNAEDVAGVGTVEGGSALDPGAVRTRKELGRALASLQTGSGLSQAAAAKNAKIGGATLSAWLKGKAIPHAESLTQYLEALAVPAGPWLAARARVVAAHSLQPPAEDPERAVGKDQRVCIGLKPWVDYYDRSEDAEEILAGILPLSAPAGEEDAGGLFVLARAIKDLVKQGAVVEVVTCYKELSVRVGSAKEFWALVSADSVLRDEKEHLPSRKWLIQETEKAVRARDEERREQAGQVWRAVFLLLRRMGELEGSDWPPRVLVEDISRRLKGFLRAQRVMRWLLEVFADDAVATEALEQAMDRYVAGRFPDWRRARPQRFDPPLVTVDDHGLCGYSFQAMRLPLTAADMAALWPQRVTTGASVLDHPPYVLGAHRDERGESLTDFLRKLLDHCRDITALDSEQGWTWALPTAPEWLELSGCTTDEHPYPWGTEAPTPRRANLRYRGEPQELQSSGIRTSGRSPSGALDCCGHVHEIVIWRSGGLTREAHGSLTSADLRLAGGSFRSRAEHSSCRKFRPLRPAPGSSRHNVGLRLIKHRTEDTGLRQTALQQFHANPHHNGG
ncbi:helix-turn-helix domain-containing protein [Streptomyces sp. NPDC057325]|uniref:helix-turn-helix domain-containing protein n=1 Tax=unclassified Streptomyces TaxID=2593676 RepID=UPI00364070FF